MPSNNKNKFSHKVNKRRPSMLKANNFTKTRRLRESCQVKCQRFRVRMRMRRISSR